MTNMTKMALRVKLKAVKDQNDVTLLQLYINVPAIKYKCKGEHLCSDICGEHAQHFEIE